MLQLIKSLFDFSGENKKRNILILSAAAGALLAIIAAVIIIAVVLLNAKTSITDFIAVSDAMGYDGEGYIELSVDYAELAKELGIEDMRSIRSMVDLQETEGYSFEYLSENFYDLEYDCYFGEFKEFFNDVYVNIENNGSFSNNDTAIIEIMVNPNGRFGNKLSGDRIEKRIDNLVVLENIELNFDCEFVGLDGDGYISCTITDEYREWHDNVYFTCDNDGFLSNGDTVCVEAYISDFEYEELSEEMLSQGCRLPQSFYKEFTITGLGQTLTLEMCNDDIIDQAEKIIQEEVVLADPTLVSHVSMVYFVEGDYSNAIVVALEFPDEEEGKVWNHIRYLSDVNVTDEGELGYSYVEHVLSGNGFSAELQAKEIEQCGDFDYCTLTKLR